MASTTRFTERDALAPDRKAVLFCPECAYESPITDNWLEVSTDAHRVLVCPLCGATVDRRGNGRRSASQDVG